MRLDLHIHTTASDGAWTPEKVVAAARRGGLDMIAIADHDTTAAVIPAQAFAADSDVQVIPAIEVSSTHEAREVHILGYFVDPHSRTLLAHTQRAFGRREARMREMVARLAEQGIDVSFEQVEAAAGPDRVNMGRPHLARALVAAGHVSSVIEAFNTLIGDRHAAFVPTGLLDPFQAVELILEAKGLPVWAHPPTDLLDALLPRLVRAGLRGLEVYRPSHGRQDVLRLEAICRTSALLMSGGSDWHTPESGTVLGDFHVSGDEVQKLLAAGGI